MTLRDSAIFELKWSLLIVDPELRNSADETLRTDEDEEDNMNLDIVKNQRLKSIYEALIISCASNKVIERYSWRSFQFCATSTDIIENFYHS